MDNKVSVHLMDIVQIEEYVKNFTSLIGVPSGFFEHKLDNYLNSEGSYIKEEGISNLELEKLISFYIVETLNQGNELSNKEFYKSIFKKTRADNIEGDLLDILKIEVKDLQDLTKFANKFTDSLNIILDKIDSKFITTKVYPSDSFKELKESIIVKINKGDYLYNYNKGKFTRYNEKILKKEWYNQVEVFFKDLKGEDVHFILEDIYLDDIYYDSTCCGICYNHLLIEYIIRDIYIHLVYSFMLDRCNF